MKATEITAICTGCKCCEAVCPKGAISFKPDSEGFPIPYIDENKCIDCHLCQNRCPQNTDRFHIDYQRVAVGIKTKNKDLIRHTASGGVFATLALNVVRNGGCVVGCAYDSQLVAKHIIVNKEEDLPLLYSSKYVQSDTSGIYIKVKEILEAGKFVLFSGTGCQSSALKSYLHKPYENLIIADIICHGIPSPLLFKKYCEWLSGKYKSQVSYVEFRSKYPKGWGLTLRIDTGKNDSRKSHYMFGRCDRYYQAYLKGKLHRFSCYYCKYNGNNRASDLTMGDFWNILKCDPDFHDYWGVSEVVVNSRKGYDFLKKNLSLFDVIETDMKTLESGNANLVHPDRMPECRSQLTRIMGLPANELFKSSYFKLSQINYVKDRLIFMLPVALKTALKRLIYTIRK